MVKKIYTLAATLIITLSTFPQVKQGFKVVQKKRSGQTTTALQFKRFNGAVQKKSSSFKAPKAYPVSQHMQRPSLAQNKRIKNLKRRNGLPIFFEIEKEKISTKSALTAEQKFYKFHKSAVKTTRLTDPVKELRILSKETDVQGITHIKAQQMFKNIEVYGGESYVHLKNDKNLFTGRIYSIDSELSTTPKISDDKALKKVAADLQTKTIIRVIPQKIKNFLGYEPVDPKLVIYENKLAYQVAYRANVVEEWIYFVDAQNGSIIHAFNNTKSDGPAKATASDLNNIQRTINTYLENGLYYMANLVEPMYNSGTNEGRIITLDAQNTSTDDLNYVTITSANNTWNNPTAVSAHYNATTAYRYYKNTYNRNSINGKGGNIISLINIVNEDGSSMENAFWNGKAAFYGNGGPSFKPLAGALDVGAHELGHGIVSTSANLEYQGQSGAINETFADIFGSMVDRDDWLIGEDITRTSFSPSGALRNMADPHNMGSSLNDPYWQPNHTREMYFGDQDNGGVHINSGIGNRAYYLYATAVTKAKAEQVFYKALTQYMTSKSQFIDFRLAVIQAAKDLYGDGSNEANKAAEAFSAVGIYEEEVIDYEQEYDTNPGENYLLTYNTDNSYPYFLYRTLTDGSGFYGLTSTDMKGKVSVLDDGSGAVFVDQMDYIRYLSLDPETPSEFELSSDAFWDNVAYSKDGTKVAAISTEVDTAIYVYDFGSSQWAKYRLYNPTTSHAGQNSGGVLYADAIEFDHSGEYLMYDAYNELNSATGDDISYWDIGFIRVWNNQTNTFGDGTITKLYENLEENVSIGNPVFSKNSPNIIAFDYFDNVNEQYGVLGADLLTGEVNVISGNTTLGYPSFSVSDDKIAFSYVNNLNEEYVAEIGLAPDKISPSGNYQDLIPDAKWPVYYAMGDRNLQLAPEAHFTVDVKWGNPPLEVQFIDQSINEPATWEWSMPGATPAISGAKNPNVVYNSAGVYNVTLTVTNNAGQNSTTKTSYVSVVATAVDMVSEKLISYYPNPAGSTLYVQTDKDYSFSLYNVSGKEVLQVYNQNRIDLSMLTPGVYILHILSSGKEIRDKLVIN